MNKYTASRTCCQACPEKHAEKCHGCIVGIHLCTDPCQECLAEDRDAEKGAML